MAHLDGVWVVSEDRTRVGNYPMARLQQDVLNVYGRSRILFLDNKEDADATQFLDLLSSYAERARYVVKSFWASDSTARAGRRRGYLTWGYYFVRDMAHFRATQSRFDLLGPDANASRQDFTTLEATGKPVIAHIIDSPTEARAGLSKGATGLRVANVTAAVPPTDRPDRPPSNDRRPAQQVRRRRAMNMASVPCRCGHSCP